SLYLLLLIATAGIFIFASSASAQTTTTGEKVLVQNEKIEFLLFHLDTCPHCKDEIKFINEKLMPKYGDYIDLKLFEVSSSKNQDLYKQYTYFYNYTASGGVPLVFINGQAVSGYGKDSTTGEIIMGIVEDELKKMGIIDTTGDISENQGEQVIVPILGSINPKNISIPLLTIVLGLLDGFNPCAMWVLIFLITLLLGMNNRKRMWLLGSIFIFTSGLVYFVFMAAWLELILFIGLIWYIRWAIGLLAVYVGSSSLIKSWKNRKNEGVVCEVTGQQKNRKIFEKIKDIIHRRSLVWSILGIIILGFSVNLVELACSAGFPAVYTQVLAMASVPTWERYLYMAGYIFFYMLDDMIVFALAMITLKATGVGGKYAKYINIFSAFLIFILGLLLLFKPQWLMFG
ncbi:hypothetical protein KJ641_03570, partial [Patescibacteria group bacterium]|nr:hypothetical protein [Patescibacteria group bacterium]MBU1895922.1 hypothetical protein [Patescibacteria group bacterium]